MTEQNKKYFHFTLGPVQSFVGQARRTRDFWAGSFLLSWLSGIAMQSAISQGGKVLFPEADECFLNAIKGDKSNAPKQGSIPNRFKVEVSADFNAKQVVKDVQKAWEELADKIYLAEIKPHKLENTKAIWDRQIEHFWDMTWVLVDDIEDSSSLDKRKNWRSQSLPDEAGIKCSLMGDWQELSGITGVNKKHRQTREAFWGKISSVNENDFSNNEMLCSMSYVKRRFLTYFASFSVELSNFTAYGWQLPAAVPSVSYIAAATWFASVLQHDESQEKIQTFFDSSKKCYGLSEYDSSIACVENASNNKKIKGIDGNSFHEIALDNCNITHNQKHAGDAKKALKALKKDFGEVSPFYAVLMMDGDSLGKQMSDRNKQEKITIGLARFTEKIPDIVSENNGFLIYAGGDDVLALVTLDDALSCALAVRMHYQNCFAGSGIDTTISAAVIYTHINSPLKNILHESHELLDDIAKERAGRDAIAVRVYKGSGLSSEWAKKWGDATHDEEFLVQTLAKQFSKQSDSDAQFSSKFFYKIRERFQLLYGKDSDQKSPISNEEAIQLMAMEFVQSSDKKITMGYAKQQIAPLMKQSVNAATEKHLTTADAALLVRFLAQKGIEGGRN